MKPATFRSAAAVSVLAFLVSCSAQTNDDGGGGRGGGCITGAQSECACPGDAKGVQVCKADGTLDTCQCEDGCVDAKCTGGRVCGEGDTCVCPAGQVEVGDVCDTDECAQGLDDCHASASCTNTAGSFACACPEGSVGDGRDCDVDECAAGTHDCHALADCTDEQPGFSCACRENHVGDGRTCDEDECATGTHDCHAMADCRDAQPGFTCTCRDGYLGDGFTCTPDPRTFVADLGTQGVIMTIEKGEKYEVRGLSRIAIELGFVRSPQGRFDKPVYNAKNSVPQVTVRRIRGSQTTLDALEDLADRATVNVLFDLSSPFGESVQVRLTGVRMKVSDGRRNQVGRDFDLAEIVLAPTGLSVNAITGAREDLVPRPTGERILEIDGITGDSFIWGRYLPGELPYPEPGVGGTLDVHNVREIVPLWLWVKSFVDGLENYRSLSVIQRNAADDEVERVNGYECMPAELRFFDPTKSYGDTLLGELVIAVGGFEDGR